MKKKKIEKEMEKMESMSPEEFGENYMKNAVIPTAKDDAEARYIVTHSAADDDSGTPNAVKWFNRIMDEFCRNNGIDRATETDALFQIVGWENGVTYSADITVYFETKDMAEKFAALIKENLLHTIPVVNYESSDFPREEYFNIDDNTVTTPERKEGDPYSVHWYMDVREDVRNYD